MIALQQLSTTRGMGTPVAYKWRQEEKNVVNNFVQTPNWGLNFNLGWKKMVLHKYTAIFHNQYTHTHTHTRTCIHARAHTYLDILQTISSKELGDMVVSTHTDRGSDEWGWMAWTILHMYTHTHHTHTHAYKRHTNTNTTQTSHSHSLFLESILQYCQARRWNGRLVGTDNHPLKNL